MIPRKNNNNNKPKYIRHLDKGDKMPKLKPRLFDLVNKMMKKSDFRYHPIHDQHKQFHPYHLDEDMSSFNPQFRKMYLKRSAIKRNITQHKAILRKSKNHQITKLKSNCGGHKVTYQNSSIVCNHLASSVEGLIVILNPNLPEYKTGAVKNNFFGFKYLVHSPYDFPYVEEVGKAIGQNIRSYIGFLGFHSWITDAADAYNPEQKKCASRHDIELDVFQEYTKKNCVFECQAKSIFKNCGCLPYQYPEFHLANTGMWKEVNSTTCNYTQLICLSEVKGMS